MLRSATAGQALARDFLRLEAARDALEDKQWRCLEDMENRKVVNRQRQKAYADILDRRLRVEGSQQSFTKERNMVIRTEATRLTSGASWEGEAVNQIRARKERFAMEVEEMWQGWQQRVASKIREDIESARRDAEHCKARQQEAMEVALTQERLLVDLLEAESLAQKEREKLYEEVEEQQRRLRQRLREERGSLDERLQAFTAQRPPAAPVADTAASASAKTAARPPTVPDVKTSVPVPTPQRQAMAEAPVTASKACGQAAPKTAGFVPKAGTRQFEVYQQLRRNEMEMQADLRLLEDRKVVHCLHCGSTRPPPISASGLCEACGHFVEVIQLPPQAARGPAIRLQGAQPQPRPSEAMPQALRLRPAPPALTSQGPSKSLASDPLADRIVTQPADVALLLGSRPCAPSTSALESRLTEARELLRPSPEACRLSPRLPSQCDALQPDGGDTSRGATEVAEALPAPSSLEAHEPEKPRPDVPATEQEPVLGDGAPGAEEPVLKVSLKEGTGEILGDLGILELPLGPPLAPAPVPRAVPPVSAAALRGGESDWYGSSTSGTPRKDEDEDAPKKAVPLSESSAEDLHFPSGQQTPRSEDKPEAVERPAAAQATPSRDAVPEVLKKPPERTLAQQEEDDSEDGDLDAMIPFSAREKAARQASPVLQVVEQPQAPANHRKPKEAAKSPEEGSLGSLASPEAPHDTSAGSFSFGEPGQNGFGEASPPEVTSATGGGALGVAPAEAPAPVAVAAGAGRGNAAPAPRPTPGILRDLGLDESSEDSPRASSKEAAKAALPTPPASLASASPASSKAAPKRSNPLARGVGGRGNLLQGSGDFLGGGMPGLGLPGSRDVGSGGALSSLAALRPKAKARPKVGSLPGGPIDWSQKEDFK